MNVPENKTGETFEAIDIARNFQTENQLQKKCQQELPNGNISN